MLAYTILFPVLLGSITATPVERALENPLDSLHVFSKRHCSADTWDATKRENWDAANTDFFLEQWWGWYLGGNSWNEDGNPVKSSGQIPEGFENDFVSLRSDNLSKVLI